MLASSHCKLIPTLTFAMVCNLSTLSSLVPIQLKINICLMLLIVEKHNSLPANIKKNFLSQSNKLENVNYIVFGCTYRYTQ